MSSLFQKVQQQAVSLAWDCWSEMGVSSWSRGKLARVIDPEGLILITACLGNVDPRLHEESQDWCLNYHWLLSRARLRTLLKDWPVAVSWGQYAGSLQETLGQPWPGAEASTAAKLTGKSDLKLGKNPSLIGLKLRAVFGVGARTEVLRVLLGTTAPRTAAELARDAGYSKRSIAEAMEGLTASGMVTGLPERNRNRYLLANPLALAGVLGVQDVTRESMLPYVRALSRLLVELRAVEEAPETVRSMEARKLLDGLVRDLGEAAFGLVCMPDEGEDAWEALLQSVRNVKLDFQMQGET